MWHVAWLSMVRVAAASCLLRVCRGYKGEVSAASALDAVVSEPNVTLVDIRTYKEKEVGQGAAGQSSPRKHLKQRAIP